MIHENITREHVLRAIEEIDRKGFPPNRKSTKFDLVFEGKYYPPKYVLARACFYATGKEPVPKVHSAGETTNECLKKLKFVIKYKNSDNDLLQVEEDIEGMEAETDVEGASKTQLVNIYERKPALRLKAIKYHGTRCKVCDFDFFEKYEQRGFGFIEVHHLVPLGTIKSEKEVDPKKDMAVLCSNCHRMIHRSKSNPLTVEQLKKLIR